MKKVIQFGAGNIGRGFIGYLLSKSEYHIIFADIDYEMIDAIKKHKKYNVEIVGKKIQTEQITNISAVLSNSKEINKIINEVSLITTAVGPKVLKEISKTIAEGIKIRYEKQNEQYLNIIACENMVGGSDYLKLEVIKYLNEKEIDYLNKYVGFPNSAVDRIVPPYEGNKLNLADVRVEDFSEWIVEKNKIKGFLEIYGMELTDNLNAYLERKLFTLNTGHAITAYMGYYFGKKTIKESIEYEPIERIVKNAMIESGNVIIEKYGFDKNSHYKYIEKILLRFKNPYLTDEVTRVGRDPIRKLSYNDRLIKPFRMALNMNLPYDNLLTGIIFALNYSYKGDKDAIKKNSLLNSMDSITALSEITGLKKESEALKIINKEYLKKLYKKN